MTKLRATLAVTLLLASACAGSSSGGAAEARGESLAVEEERAPIRVLVITATSRWRHGDAIEAAREVLQEAGRTTEFEFDLTEDLGALMSANLAQYDVLFFANSTLHVAEPDNPRDEGPVYPLNHENPAPPLTPAQQQAILDFVRSGKGVAVAHAGLDALFGWSEYREMVGGGLYRLHPWVQTVRITVEEPNNPAAQHFGESFELRDEIYVLDRNPRETSRVLLSLDVDSVDLEEAPAGTTAHDYPLSWIRSHEGGRVFVTVLGHFPEVWHTPAYVEHLLQGMRIAAGRVEADLSRQPARTAPAP
ncbi:MAG: ThuA domain-containing protein [Gemmatimonadetes bacterium]|nr:ThuA domain-containing protein [Gemmatimonadota bacterium]